MIRLEKSHLAKVFMKAQRQNHLLGIILKGYPRLSETFIMNEILLLEELGYKLQIFALRHPGELQVHAAVQRVRAHVAYIPDEFWKSCFAFILANVRAWRRCSRRYWQAFRFALRQSVSQKNSAPLKRFAQAGYLVGKSLEGTEVSHFHAHFSHDPTTVAYFVSWLTGISYSFSAHAKDIYVQDQAFLQEKMAQARFVVTCTECNTNYLQSLRDQSGGSTAVLRCYHGVDLELFSPPAKRSINPVPQILSIGRLVPKKGFPVLLQALYRLRLQGFEFCCTIIGDGPMANILRKKITEANLDDCVQLLASMPQHELLRYYHSTDLFALACEVDRDGDRDGIPNVIVEAMAMAIPVVSTRVAGIPECVEHGRTGLLVAEKDAAALCEAMAKLLSAPRLARRFGRAGRKKVVHEFNVRRNIAQIDVALSKVVGHNGKDEVQLEGEILAPAMEWNRSPGHRQIALDNARW
ncbi:MAG: glycosyltransferase [bacterium]